MVLLDRAFSVSAFWARVRQASLPALWLDYDGTLAPFNADRERAWPYPGVRQRLNDLQAAGRTHLAIVSGRPAADLPALLGLETTPEIYGGHGWDHRDLDGSLTRAAPAAATLEVLATACARAWATGWAGACERKAASVALHWRGLPPHEAMRRELAAYALLEPLAADGTLLLLPFAAGLELRAAGRDKGWVVRACPAFQRGEAMAYLGDDHTDEDAFRAMDGHGLAGLVGVTARPTAAHVLLQPPADVLAFLDRWQAERLAGNA